MEPRNSPLEQRPHPTDYSEYQRLCESTGFDQQLDQSLFDEAIADWSRFRDVLSAGASDPKSDVTPSLFGLSEDEVLKRLGIALHLQDLMDAAANR